MLEWHSLEWVWPRLLWLQAVIPLGWVCVFFMKFRSTKSTPTSASASLWFATASVPSTKWRRYGMAGLLYAGCALMLLSVARPKAVLLLPSRLDSVVIAIDSSGSMRAADVKPSRIAVAQGIANRLIDTLPTQVKLGVVSMAGTASLVQAPTDERDDLRKAVEDLSLQPGSAVGSGLVIALHALLPASGIDVKKIIAEGEDSRGTAAPPESKSLDVPPAASSALASTSREVHKLEPGANKSQALVLITDGQGNLGPDPLKMAQIAADLGVRVYTIGVGTTAGAVLKAKGMQMRVKLDEEVLKKIADMTAGEYFKADAEPALEKIYQQLSTAISLKKHRQNEVTVLFALLGMGLVMLHTLLRLRQVGRVI